MSKAEFQFAISECLKLSTDCSEGPHGPIGSWDVSTVTDMSGLFDEYHVPASPSFDGDISEWDVSKVTTMYGMFYSASSFNSDISKWDVSKVTDMGQMFSSASSFNCDISKWQVSWVEEMTDMFSGASSFKQTLCGAWSTTTAEKKGMFDDSPGRICETSTTTSS